MSLKKLTRFKDIPVEAKASTAYALCSVLQNCLAFITLPIFARLLTTEEFGDYTIYASWMAVLVIFVTLNLPYGSFSTAMVKFEDERDKYIASVETICIVLASIFLLIYFPFRGLWNRLFELPTYLVLIMFMEMLGNAGILFWSGKKMFEYKYKGVVWVTLLVSVVSPVLAYIMVINSDERGYARIVGYAVVKIVVGGIIYIANLVKGKNLFRKDFWVYALSFNLPLVFYYLSQVIFNQSDRIMISHYIDKSAAGMYGAAYTLAIVLNFVLTAINNSYVPWFFGKLKEKKQKDNQSISCMVATLMAILLSGVIWLAPEIISIMAGKKFLPAVGVVPPVAMSLLLLFYAQLFINVEFFYEKKGLLVIASIFSAGINIGLNAIFIPLCGYVAAGYTTLFSYLVFAIANYYAMKKVLKEKEVENNAYNIKFLILIFVVFCITSFIAGLLYDYYIIRYLVIAVVMILMIANYKKILKYVNVIRNM
ncbi:MAG: oligosaccharide flippase family protein [Lachnospiraceae bacterium]|nr:oligosaccharide flippase family protein [Lachnospiraceae bacterium]